MRLEGENRRLADELSIIKLKLRKMDELQDSIDSLAKQNAILAQTNDQLGGELADKKYELERFRMGSAQAQEREVLRNGQLQEINRSMEMEIELLKKEKI